MAMRVKNIIGKRIELGGIWYKLDRPIPCPPIPLDNDYPVRKKMLTSGLLITKSLILVPGKIDDETTAFQVIDSSGNKKFLCGSKVSGCGFIYGEPNSDTYYIAEGIATASTIYEEHGNCVYAAFTSTNLKSLATRLRGKYPKKDIIICGDDDHTTVGNPGMKHAIAAAKAARAAYTFPDFNGLDRGPKDSDFNDLKRLLEAHKNEAIE